MKNKRILITGSSGFIGKALVANLTVDNTVIPVFREQYYKSGFKEWLQGLNIQIIINCGAYGNHSDQTDDQETFEANIVKTFLLLNDTKDIPYEAFINIGSSSEYGVKTHAMSEEDKLEPLTMYAGTKASGTMLARVFAKKYNKPIVTVRPFSVYGPGEAEHRFIPTVIRSLIKDEEMTLEPMAQHDWIYVDDFVDGILAVIDKAQKLAGNAVNIGSGKQYQNKAITSLLSFIAGKELKANEKTLRLNDSTTWVADNSLLRICGWRPNTELMDGLKKTYEYYKGKYEVEG